MPKTKDKTQQQPFSRSSVNVLTNTPNHRVKGCELCEELSNPSSSRFGQLYRGKANSRIVDQEDGFVAMPTLGQLFKGSLLILPVQHVETMAQVPSASIDSLFALLKRLEERLQSLGLPVLFEHGAKCSSGGGCGIHHAHFHLVPLPKPIDLTDILPNTTHRAKNLIDALTQLQRSDEYVLFRDTGGYIAFQEVTDEQSRKQFPSQYFRRQLTQHFHRKQAWDWRAYTYQEPWLLETLEWFSNKANSTSVKIKPLLF